MSAIFGVICWDGEIVVAEPLQRMDRALARHGEGGRLWRQANAGMGQRLARVTPEDRVDRQPLTSPDGRFVLVSDGRIDNRSELIAALRTHNPASELLQEMTELPDSALLLCAYQTWGEKCLTRIVGAFVFAVWDVHRQRLFMAQPRLSERSLVYWTTPQKFAFATMSSALLALGEFSGDIDLAAVADYLVDAPREPGSSFHHNIRRLDQSHSLIAQDGRVTVQQHWQPDLNKVLRLPKDDDYVDAFLELFETVVGEHLRSATPAGLMMSGGLDSTAIAAIAAPKLAKEGMRLATFTEVPPSGFAGALIAGRYADETPFVQAMAHRYPTLELNLVRSDGQFFLDHLGEYFSMTGAPFRNASNRPWMETLLRAAQSQNISVMLDGAAGNLTISWNGAGLLPQLLRAGHVRRTWREAGQWRTFLGQGILPLLPASTQHAVQRVRRWNDPMMSVQPSWRVYSPIRLAFAEEQYVNERAAAKGHEWYGRQPTDLRRLRAAVLTTPPNGGADIATGYRAWFGVELRSPAGDLRIFEFCLSLPEEQFLRHGESRWLLRRAMADRLPAAILNNKQRGLQSADWFERLIEARPAIVAELAHLQSSELAQHVLDLPRLNELVARLGQPGGSPATMMMDYHSVLERGLMVGRFLRWLECGE